MISFKDWLNKNEATTSGAASGMTSTSDVAVYARPIGMGMVKRSFPSILTVDDLEKKKKKKIKF